MRWSGSSVHTMRASCRYFQIFSLKFCTQQTASVTRGFDGFTFFVSHETPLSGQCSARVLALTRILIKILRLPRTKAEGLSDHQPGGAIYFDVERHRCPRLQMKVESRLK